MYHYALILANSSKERLNWIIIIYVVRPKYRICLEQDHKLWNVVDLRLCIHPTLCQITRFDRKIISVATYGIGDGLGNKSFVLSRDPSWHSNPSIQLWREANPGGKANAVP